MSSAFAPPLLVRSLRCWPVVAALLSSFLSQGQTLIINEVSNGPSGTQEFIEMLVVPTTPPEPCAPPQCLDIRGWIIDDNNGNHATGSDVGVAAGALRFSATAAIWSCVPVGTLIVIYNGGDPNPSMPPQDLSLTDGNCSVVASVASGLFETTGTTPPPTPCTYPGGWGPATAWNCIGMRNPGDCARITDGAGCEIFSVCYGDNSLDPLIYFAGPGGQRQWYFNDGDPYSQASWSQGCTNGCETPGAPNSPANAAYIAALNNNCTPIIDAPLQVDASATATCACDGTATAEPTGSASPYSFTWFDDAWTPLGQTDITATGLCPGIYHVEVTSAAGCIDTGHVEVPVLPGPDAGSDGTAVLCPGDAALDLFLELGGTPDAGGAWSPPLSSGTGVFDPTLDMAGLYTYTVSTPGCTPATAEVDVVVGTSADLTIVIDSISCHGVDDGRLEVIATGQGPFDPVWDQGLGAGAVQADLGPGIYTVNVTDGNGCNATANATLVEPVFLEVEAQATAAFCGFTNGRACAVAAGGTGSWTFDWDAGAHAGPCYDPVGPGVHNVQVTDLHGCTANATVQVEDSVPEIVVDITPITCATSDDGGILLTLPAPTVDLQWTGPDAFSSTAEELTGLAAGTYNYIWTDANGCVLTDAVVLAAPSVLQMVVTVTPESCQDACDGAFDVALLNGVQPVAFSLMPPNWGGGHFGGLCAGAYTIYGVDAHGCAVQVQADVPAGPAGANAAIVPVDPLCVYDAPIVLQGIDPGGTWSGPGIVDADLGVFDPSVAGAGGADIVHTIPGSCNGQGTITIQVVAPPPPLFSVDVQGPVGAELIVTATNHTIGDAAFFWLFDGEMVGNTHDLVHRLDAVEAGDHAICLITVDAIACADTLCTTFAGVQSTDVFVPNSFTPDGDDINDLFGVVVRGIEPTEGGLQIYDRWGELLFEGTGLAHVRWDGMFQGRSLPPEVYVWRMHYRDPTTREVISRIGHVTLLR